METLSLHHILAKLAACLEGPLPENQKPDSQRALDQMLDSHELWLKTLMTSEQQGQRAVCIGAKLDGLDFRGRRLIGATFSQCSLAGAQFDHADLRLADFRGSDRAHASFAGANLTDCLVEET
jgi:uncharacterized protein YjbI with pentapeptide repeats